LQSFIPGLVIRTFYLNTCMAKQTTGDFHSHPRSPFRHVSRDIIQQVTPHIKQYAFKKKQLIFREGFKPDGLFLVRKGNIKVSKNSSNGKEVILFIAKENDVLGFISLLNNVDYMASAEAIDEAEVYFFPKKVFFDIVATNSNLLVKLTQAFTRQYESAVNKLVDVSTKQVRRRIAETLMSLMKVHGVEDDNLTINISLSREDLAHLVGTNTETLVRILSEFKKEKMIAIKGRKIQLINLALLTRAISIT